MTANSPLKEFADKLARLLDEQAALAADIKDKRAEVKALGFNVKAFNQVVKEMRKGAKYQADQLELELELDTYRANAGLPVTLEDAQERARKEAESVPAPDKNARARGMH
jgi:uncharacterized protein (UPF0335 family)